MIEATGVNHIGIAVRSLEAHRSYYETVLGATLEAVEEVPTQGVRVAFYRLGGGAGGVRLELLEPLSPDSPVERFLEKRGEGVHHVAFDVSGIEERLRALREGGVELIDDTARAGAHGTRIAFLHPRSTGGVLTELVEPQDGG